VNQFEVSGGGCALCIVRIGVGQGVAPVIKRV